jgi:hypothetical protein
VRITDTSNGGGNNNGDNDDGTDILTVHDASSGALLSTLGLVQLQGDYTTGTLSFTGSTMTVSGNTVTIVLGTASGSVHKETNPATMIWSTPQGTANESGPSDVDF